MNEGYAGAGSLTIAYGPSPSGKSTAARAWQAEHPITREVFEEAENLHTALDLVRLGYDVWVTLPLPQGATVNVIEFTHTEAGEGA